MSYTGATVKIWLNYNLLYTGSFPELPTEAGKLGLRVSNYSQARVDDFFQHTSAPNNSTVGENLVLNNSFEDAGNWQQPANWYTWTSSQTDNADYIEAGDAHSGEYQLVHFLAAPYDVFTYQNLSDLENGIYTMTAWVKSSGGQSTAQMVAKLYGGNDLTIDLPSLSEWTLVSIPNINVTNHQCQIGFFSIETYPTGGKWIMVDDVTFSRQY